MRVQWRRGSSALIIVAACLLNSMLGTRGSYAAEPVAKADPVRGEQVYAYWCAPCHGRGPGHPGTQSLEVKYGGQQRPAALEGRNDLSAAVTIYTVRHGVAVMPPFRKTEISDAQLSDLAAYLARAK